MMSFLAAFTLFHVLVSLVEIVAGIALIRLFIKGGASDRLTIVFLASTAVTLLTGFLFPFHGLTPAIVIGALNVLILIPVALAWRSPNAGPFRARTFIYGSLALLFFDCLVLIVQSFQKIPPLHALAPLGNEPAILVCQTLLLIATVVVAYLCFRALRKPAGMGRVLTG